MKTIENSRNLNLVHRKFYSGFELEIAFTAGQSYDSCAAETTKTLCSNRREVFFTRGSEEQIISQDAHSSSQVKVKRSCQSLHNVEIRVGKLSLP